MLSSSARDHYTNYIKTNIKLMITVHDLYVCSIPGLNGECREVVRPPPHPHVDVGQPAPRPAPRTRSPQASVEARSTCCRPRAPYNDNVIGTTQETVTRSTRAHYSLPSAVVVER